MRRLILPAYPSVLLLTLLCINLICLKANAQGSAPQLTVAEDMPDTDVVVRQVTYGNGVFLACLIRPTRLYRSVDGLSWSKIAGPALGTDTNIKDYGQVPSLAFGAGRFVLVSESGRIFSSPDLVTWTASVSGTTHTLNVVKYLNGNFYAIGDSASFLISPDGLTWTPRQIGIGDPTGSYQDILYGNGHLVITAFNRLSDTTASNVVYDSTAGGWTSDSSRFFNYHGFAKGRFYEFGPDSISVSTDMQHWSAVSLPPNVLGGSDVFEDSAHVYLVAANYDTVLASPVWRSKITSSDDGIHFGPLYPTLIPGSGGGGYFSHRYFVWSNTSSGAMAVSADGLHYHIGGSTASLLATNGSIYVKMSVTLQETHLYTSPDLTNWTPRDTVTGAVGLTYDGTKFWAVGSQTYTSTDGTSWVNNGPSAHPFTGFAYVNGTYIAWEQGAPDPLWYSTDGSSWTQSVTPTTVVDPHAPPQPVDYGHVRRVRSFNGHIFVVANGMILYSTDGGANYSLDYAGNYLGQSLADVAYVADSAKYYFFAWGNGNGTLAPYLTTAPIADPFNPAPQPFLVTDTVQGLPSDMQLDNFYAVEYSHGHFISVVRNRAFPPYPNSYLLYSSNGINWGSHMLDRETQFTSVITRSDTFNIEGTHNYHILASFAGSTPLPISLLNFNARADDNTHVLLTWQTAREQNSRRFIIQRKTGVSASAWDSTGYVPAAGNSNLLLNYSFTDEHPLAGYNNYRLLLMDADNSYKASEIKQVYIGVTARITAYPNPVKDQLVIQRMADDGGTSAVTLYDAGGRVMLARVFTGYTLTLSLDQLPAGIYHLTVRQPNGEVYQKEILH
jgi:hypothetical protein